MCHRHLRDIAFTSVTPCAHYIRLLVYHSIFRKNLLLPCYHVLNTLLPCLLLLCTMSLITLYHVFHYSVTMSWISCYHVSYYPVPCLPLLCYYVFHYPVSCLSLPCLMSSITLLLCLPLPCYYVFHYPVSIKECKTTKKSWQVNYPKDHTPQNN